MERKYEFTDLEAAYRFYMQNGGTMHTAIPGKLWIVTVYN